MIFRQEISAACNALCDVAELTGNPPSTSLALVATSLSKGRL